jgi:hypothetical protein
MVRGIHRLPKVFPGPAMPNPSNYALWVGHPQNSLTAVSAVASPQGGRPAVVFYPLGYSMRTGLAAPSVFLGISPKMVTASHAGTQNWSKMGLLLVSEGRFRDQGDAKWIIIRGQLMVIVICPLGGQPLAGLLAALGMATLRAYLMVSVTIN